MKGEEKPKTKSAKQKKGQEKKGAVSF